MESSFSDDSSGDPLSIEKKKQNKKHDSKALKNMPSMKQLLSRRFVVLTRTAERVDRAFPEWMDLAFEDGDYKPYDPDMPGSIIKRPEGHQAFVDDSPITELGKQNSQEIGRSLSTLGMWPFDAIYISPALRSIQTASMIIRGAGGSRTKLRIEPALCDYAGWYSKLPLFLPTEYIAKAGYPIDANYKPLVTIEHMHQLVQKENLIAFYHRIGSAISKITHGLNGDPSPNRILFVVHAPVMDAALKALKNSSGSHINTNDFLHMGSYYPYSSTITLAQDGMKWSYVHEPIPALNYRSITTRVNTRFIERTTKTRPSQKEKQEKMF